MNNPFFFIWQRPTSTEDIFFVCLSFLTSRLILLYIQKHRGVKNVKEKCCSDKRYRKKECLILRPIHLSDLPIKRMVGSATLDSDSISIHSYNIIYFAVLLHSLQSLSLRFFYLFSIFFLRKSKIRIKLYNTFSQPLWSKRYWNISTWCDAVRMGMEKRY